jgi:hypothetical protein
VGDIITTNTVRTPKFTSSINNSAATLAPEDRKNLGIQAIAGIKPITELANDNNVSRKFIYSQKDKASYALNSAFSSKCNESDVLFYIPVTKKWIRQLVLALTLICHSSFRGVTEVLDSVFDYKISVATVHNIIHDAIDKARKHNYLQDLSSIRHGAHDEIFQNRKPVLVGMDIESTYCYLLSAEEHRCETTWGVNLLELSEQGLCPDYTIADFGRGMRAGQAAAWPGIPCNADAFHPSLDIGRLVIFLNNRAAGCSSAREKLEAKMESARKRRKGNTLSKRLAVARESEAQAVELAEDISTLADWMKNDILALGGPDHSTKQELLDFVVEELKIREQLCPHRIRPVRTMLENNHDTLLAFVQVIDKKLIDIAKQMDIPSYLVRSICELLAQDKTSEYYWQNEAKIRSKLREKFYTVESAVKKALAQTPRASSIVENLNSRLRNYFFLRRQIGNQYLELLRFFLNHRRFIRSDRPERVGKSPAELLNGERHPHWLEMLGFERFCRNTSLSR